MRRCPLKRAEAYCLKKKILTERQIADLRSKIQKEIDEAVTFAKSSPFPEKEDLYRNVFYED